jgi:hypothetical protein
MRWSLRRPWTKFGQALGAGSTGCIQVNWNVGGKRRRKPWPEPGEARAAPNETRADKKRIQELERELLRKERALAETAALLVLSKKLSAIFPEHAAV